MTRGTRVGVDVGGTFTDLVAVSSDGTIAVHKVLSTPDDPSRAVLEALDRPPALAPEVLVHGTTVATNTLLERTGARVVLVTTAGFEDLLWLGRQDRAALYDLARRHPPPLVDHGMVVGAAERMGPEGVVTPLTDAELARVVDAVMERQPEAIAVALLFAFRHPAHERRLAAALADAFPGLPVVASHAVLPVFREYERCCTTVAEAYLRPRIARYVARLGEALAHRAGGAIPLRVMTSSGGSLAPEAAARHAASLALSGPAGGVVGAALAGAGQDGEGLLTLDMGGTSADAGLVTSGAPVMMTGTVVGGVPLALPAVLVETVSAGGGSLAWVDEGGALRVGPRSAGATPGPACYGRGGNEATVTDACLTLGWLDPQRPLAAAVRLQVDLAHRALAPLAERIGRDVPGTAEGIIAVATATMARALKRVSVARGVDSRTLTLVPFGGAGPLFGCLLAEALGTRRVLIPPHPGALSALGLAVAAERVERVASVHRRLGGATLDGAALAALYAPVVAAAAAELPGAALSRLADCRFAGQGYEVTVPAPADDPAVLRAAFYAAHRARYGYAEDGEPVELVNVRVVAERGAAVPRWGVVGGPAPRPSRRRMTLGGAMVDAAEWALDRLPAGTALTGPAILSGGDATALVPTGWTGIVGESGAVLLRRGGER